MASTSRPVMLKLQEEPVHKYQIQKDNIKTNGKHKQNCYVKIARGRRNRSCCKSTNTKEIQMANLLSSNCTNSTKTLAMYEYKYSWNTNGKHGQTFCLNLAKSHIKAHSIWLFALFEVAFLSYVAEHYRNHEALFKVVVTTVDVLQIVMR